MKSSRTWFVWAAFILCAVTILGAIAWQTRNAMTSEKERATAVRQAQLQEKMRLSLWRMDTLAAALLLEEEIGGKEDFIHSRLEWKESGQLTQPDGSPASAELQRAITQPGYTFERYLKELHTNKGEWDTVTSPSPVVPEETSFTPSPKFQDFQQRASNRELEMRSSTLKNVADAQKAALEKSSEKITKKNSSPNPKKVDQAEMADASLAESKPEIEIPSVDGFTDVGKDHAPAEPADLEKSNSVAAQSTPRSPTRPLWIGEELFLLRTVSGSSSMITGSWVNIKVLEARLLKEIQDLLPNARLIPALAPSDDGLVLATLPLRLVPGEVDSVGRTDLPRAILVSLATGWIAALLAILAASILIFGIMRLSERRASFVSAVTHELRTPLTTFRLYSDMLERDAVKPEKRGNYLRVLSREADRLSHLVENVLAFSRIERGSARSAVTSVRVDELLAPMRERFEERLATAGMALHMPLSESLVKETIHTDVTAVEHILFNLVDNAAKYAAGGTLPMLEISVCRHDRNLEIHVSDDGPGIPQNDHQRIFKAFHKSAREAAESHPGVGLGLALSRRLAREMGGDLTYRPSKNGGATFVFTLPA